MRRHPWSATVLAAALAAVMLVSVVLLGPAQAAHRHRDHRAAPAAVQGPPQQTPQPNSTQANSPPNDTAPPPSVQSAPAANAPSVNAPAATNPAEVVVDKQEIVSILGKNVRSSAGEDMGRLIDMLVDRNGQPRAAIIDFGGFLGVGSRKIAIDWKALHFSPDDPNGNAISLALTRDQVKAAPEYKDGSPVVILTALGELNPVPTDRPAEK
jgi:hypothetical protein